LEVVFYRLSLVLIGRRGQKLAFLG
jgi:hypothetical protein